MLTVSDFLSWPVLLQAILAGSAALMAWRSLHLSGDRRLAPLWGTASVATFVVALVVGAIGNHESTEAIRKANGLEETNAQALIKIQDGISDLKKVVAPDGASVEQVLAAAVTKIQNQQREIDSLRGRTLSPLAQADLAKQLRGLGRHSFSVTYVPEDFEAESLGRVLRQVLIDAGWEESRPIQ